MSRLHARILAPGDRPAWQALHARSHRVLVHHWDWADCAAVGVGRPVRIGVAAADGALVAGAVFIERRHKVFTHWHSPAPLPDCGLLLDREPGEEFLRDILREIDAAVPRSVSLAEIAFGPAIADVRALQWAGWQAMPHYNYVSAIDREGALADAAVSATRRWARKAAEAGLDVRMGAEHLDAVLRLWEETRDRKGLVDFTPAAMFRAMAALPAEHELAGALRAAIAVDPTGAAHAGVLLLVHGRTAYYIIGATRRAEGEKGTGAPAFLQFAVADALFREIGPFAYDWCGANTPSVVQFKKDFRPRLVCGILARKRSGIRRWI